MLSYYILIPSIVASMVVGAVVTFTNPRRFQNIVYGLLTIVFVTIAIANTLSLEINDQQIIYIRIVMAATSIGVYLLLLLVRSFVSGSARPAAIISTTTPILLVTILMVIIDFSPLLFSDVIHTSPPQPVAQFGAVLYVIHFLTLSILSMHEAWSAMHTRRLLAKERQQFKFILIGTLPIVVFAPLTGLFLPLVFSYTALVVVTPVYTFLFVLGVGYAIARHGLFDIKKAAVRTIAYILSLLTMAAIYFGLAYTASATYFRESSATGFGASLVNVMLALALAFLFQPIKKFFDRTTDRIFFRNRYSASEFIASFGALLASTSELKQLLETAATKIVETLKSSEVTFVIHRDDKDDEIVGSPGPSAIAKTDLVALRGIFSTLGNVVVLQEVIDGSQYTPEQRRMIRSLLKHQYALVMPIGEGVGYALLGEQKSGGYKHRDVAALESIRDELFIAIQNARSLEEVRKFNKTLQQRVYTATKELRNSNTQLKKIDETKDEFISMASHQLRTPLTSIKGYVSMLLDGDAGELNPHQRKLLSEAFVSSERMVRLIGDFLNVSRLQTGKFIIDPKKVDLTAMVREEIDSIERMAEQHEVKISFKSPKNIPEIAIDEDKTRQVVMNFIDNAVFYSRPKSTIVIQLEKDEKYVILEVHDHGIGVPKDAQEQLFSKFFRADNARRKRPDGTGIGLYLAKKIITAQGGEVLFSSTEGKGSMFGFRLPIKQPTARQ